MKRIAIYLRVSTTEQTVENQQRELEMAAERHGWQVVVTLADEGISGSKRRDKRPAFDRLCKGIARREFDLVAAWSVDRLGRSLQDLVGFLGELHGKGIDLYLHQQGIDTTTPAGKAMFQMMGVFAEFERAMIVERVKSGLARARMAGKRLGRPTISRRKEEAVRRLLIGGTGIVKAAKTVGVGVSVAQRIKAELTALAPLGSGLAVQSTARRQGQRPVTQSADALLNASPMKDRARSSRVRARRAGPTS